MKISEQGLALIRQYEGFSDTLYICPAGKPTIGYGHVVRSGEDFPGAISRDEAETLLQSDVTWAEQAVGRCVSVAIQQCQFDALVSFTYNVGAEALEKSLLLRQLNAQNPAMAAHEFSRWVYAAGKKLPGLTARRAAEAALFTKTSA
jgi:lysozyme